MQDQYLSIAEERSTGPPKFDLRDYKNMHMRLEGE
jgi:hypothetical protein